MKIENNRFKHKIEKIFFSYPIMILFYFCIKKSIHKNYFKHISLFIFYIQILFHTFQLLFYYQCTPKKNLLCNKIALVFGLIHFIIFIFHYKNENKNNIFYFIGIFISFYMILSHIIHIKIIN